MLDSNIFRLLMFICIMAVVSIGIHLLVENLDDLKNAISQFYSYRLKKY